MVSDFRRSVIIGASVLAGSVLIFGGALVWLRGRLELQERNIVQSRTLIRQNARAIELLAELKKIAPEVRLYENQMYALLPTKDELIDFRGWLDGQARVHGVAFSFSYQGGTSEPGEANPGSVGFAVDVSGASGAVSEFFRAIEKNSSRFIVGIETYEASRSGESHRIVARGKVFFRP